MGLSQENINKLCMTGIYECEPVLSWIESWRRDEPYHCINWIFKVFKSEYSGKYYMEDTYWSSDNLQIELNDENYDKFKLLFDINEVDRISSSDFYDYDENDRWHIALDSGGWTYSNYYFIRKNAKKNKEILLDRLNRELDSLKKEVEWKEQEIKKVLAEDAE